MQEYVPLAFVLPKHGVPSDQEMEMVELAANPWAVNVTTTPWRPLVGLTMSRGVTVTTVEAVFEDRSTAVNECAPAVDGGRVKVQEKLPTELVV